MTRQTLQVLGDRRQFSGYAEIGSKGRYFRGLAAALEIDGPRYFIDEKPPGFSPVDLMERGQLPRLSGAHLPLADYAPLPADRIADAEPRLRRLLRRPAPHDGRAPRPLPRVDPSRAAAGRRVHRARPRRAHAAIARPGVAGPYGVQRRPGRDLGDQPRELRFFEPVATWVERLDGAGFKDSGHRVLQDNDPTDNMLLCFTRQGPALPDRAMNDGDAPAQAPAASASIARAA